MKYSRLTDLEQRYPYVLINQVKDREREENERRNHCLWVQRRFLLVVRILWWRAHTKSLAHSPFISFGCLSSLLRGGVLLLKMSQWV